MALKGDRVQRSGGRDFELEPIAVLHSSNIVLSLITEYCLRTRLP